MQAVFETAMRRVSGFAAAGLIAGALWAGPSHAGLRLITTPLDEDSTAVTDPEQPPVDEATPAPPPRPEPEFDAGGSERLALIVSIAAYDDPSYGTTERTTGQADAVADTLRGLGYRVMRVRDADRDGLLTARDRFAEAVAPESIVTVYYTGLGSALPDETGNRLIPADFPPSPGSSDTATAASLGLADLVAPIRDRDPAGLFLFYDGCDADPLAQVGVLQEGAGTAPCRPADIAGIATLYSAGAGTDEMQADLGVEPGVLSQAVIDALKADPALRIDAMMETVALRVKDRTEGRQVPDLRLAFREPGTETELCIAPSAQGCTAPEPAEAPPPEEISGAAENPMQDEAWRACADAQTPSACEDYLARYPESANAAQARQRIADLQSDAIVLDPGDYVPFSGTRDAAEAVDAAAMIETCDTYAAHPNNPDNPPEIEGILYGAMDATKALPACLKAAEAAPDNLRIRYQLARSKQAAGQVEEAIVLFTGLAEEHDYAPAMSNLGSIFQLGMGVDEDSPKAERWFRMAAERDYVPAMTMLGWMHQSGSGVPKSRERAFSWYRRAAEGGSASAMHSLAFMYENGWGIEADSGEAARWFEAAAEAGHAQAMAMTAWVHQVGRGVDKDLSKAFQWYERATEEGLPSAMGALGGLYDSGVPGVERSPEKAAEWLIEGLRKGDTAVRDRLVNQPITLQDDTRKAIQLKLAEIGFDPGPADGVFGSKTRRALEAAFPE